MGTGTDDPRQARPRFVIVVTAAPREEGDVSVVSSVVRRAGVNAMFAYELTDLDVMVRRGECDIALVDRASRGGAARVARMAKTWTEPPRLVSLRFFRDVKTQPPKWACAHVVYGSAEQLAAELVSLAAAWRIDHGL